MAEPLSEAELQATVTQEAAYAIGNWLEGARMLEKRVRHLSLEELECLAAVAISQAILTRARLTAAERPLSRDEGVLI